MQTKKAIIVGAVTLIVIVTIAVLAMKAQVISYPVNSPSRQTTAPASQVQPKTGDSTQIDAQADPDVTAIENDLNSVSEDDFSDSSLSDQAVGL